MEEELKALGELMQELGKKYDAYITLCTFNGDCYSGCAQTKEGIKVNLYGGKE